MSQRSYRPYLVALVDQLMSSCDELQAVDVVEFGRDLVSEQPAGASGRYSPRVDVFRVTPYEIAESALVWDLLCSRYNADLVQCADLRRQTSVDAQDLAIDDGCEGEEVKDLAAGLPD